MKKQKFFVFALILAAFALDIVNGLQNVNDASFFTAAVVLFPFVDEKLCGLLVMKMTTVEKKEQVQIKVKGSLFGDDTQNEYKFTGVANLSLGNLLRNSTGIINVSISLDELDVTHGKMVFHITEDADGVIKASFERWTLDCGEEEE